MRLKMIALLLPVIVACCANIAPADDAAPAAGPYSVLTTLQVGGEGRWDYITCDSANKLLYVPRSSHVMILSADTGKSVADVPGTAGVHGVALVPALNRAFASDGEDGTVTIFDTASHNVLGKIKAAEDADGIIYDPAMHRVLVGCGDSKCVIGIADDVDPAKGAPVGTLDLGGKPEFLAADGEGHAFINITDKNLVVEFDPKTMTKLAEWTIGEGTKPTSMAIDPAHHLLFVGCRNKLMVILDTQSGKVVNTRPIGKGVDATVFDDGKILASCGDGTLWVISEESPTSFKPLQTLTTLPGARTLAVDHEMHKLYLPTAEMKPANPDKPKGRPEPVEGSFKIVVVGMSK